MEQLENESVQLAYSFDQEHLNTALNHGFTPLVSFEMFGREAFKGCFYVHKDSPIKTMKDIRGKRAVVYSTPFPYYLLRDFLEEDPAAYFSKLTPSPDGQSILMAVAMGVEEVGFAKEQNYFFLKILDGGTYSKLRKVGCTGRDFINAPLLVHRSLPKEVIKDVRSYLMHLTKNKDLLQKYRGMATMTKFKVIPAKPEHLADYHAVMDRVETEGWKKDYLLWLSGQQAK